MRLLIHFPSKCVCVSPQQSGAEALLQACVVGLSQSFLGKNHHQVCPRAVAEQNCCRLRRLLSQMATSNAENKQVCLIY